MEYKQKIRYQGVILKEFSLKELKIELTDAAIFVVNIVLAWQKE